VSQQDFREPRVDAVLSQSVNSAQKVVESLSTSSQCELQERRAAQYRPMKELRGDCEHLTIAIGGCGRDVLRVRAREKCHGRQCARFPSHEAIENDRLSRGGGLTNADCPLNHDEKVLTRMPYIIKHCALSGCNHLGPSRNLETIVPAQQPDWRQ
jgi:hypothetical protein